MDADLAIIGGGLVGLTAAQALARQGYSIVVFNPSAQNPVVEKRLFGLTAGSLRRLSQWGLAFDRSDAAVIAEIEVADQARCLLHLTAKQFGLPYLGMNIPYTTFYAQATQSHPNIQFHDVAITKLDRKEYGWECHDSHGRTWNVPFVIGADGHASLVRSALATHFKYQHHFQQKAYVSIIKCPDDRHPLRALQGSTGNALLGLLPYAPGQRYVVVTTADLFDWDELLGSFASRIGPSEVIASHGPYPLSSYHVSQQSYDNALLIGLAAKSFHPAAALGLNQSVYEIALFSQLVSSAQLKTPSLWKNRFEALVHQRSRTLRLLTSTLATPWCRSVFSVLPFPSTFIQKHVGDLIL